MLRPWRVTDAGDLLRAVQSADDLDVQVGGTLASESDARRWLEFAGAGWSETRPNYRFFAIVSDGVAVGNVGIGSIDWAHRNGWFSYWLADAVDGASLRGQGITTRSCTAVANWALSDFGLFRLELGHRTNNPASCVVATKAGFVVEGLERQKLQYGDERFDVETHARLATDPVPPEDGVAFATS